MRTAGLKNYMKAAPVSERSRVRIPYKQEFFLFATAKVASIAAMIFFHIIHLVFAMQQRKRSRVKRKTDLNELNVVVVIVLLNISFKY